MKNENSPHRHFAFWTEIEEEELLRSFKNGKSIEEIANIHQRTHGSISSRIEHIVHKMHTYDRKTYEDISNDLNLPLEFVKGVVEKKNNSSFNIKQELIDIKKELAEIKKLLVQN